MFQETSDSQCSFKKSETSKSPIIVKIIEEGASGKGPRKKEPSAF